MAVSRPSQAFDGHAKAICTILACCCCWCRVNGQARAASFATLRVNRHVVRLCVQIGANVINKAWRFDHTLLVDARRRRGLCKRQPWFQSGCHVVLRRRWRVGCDYFNRSVSCLSSASRTVDLRKRCAVQSRQERLWPFVLAQVRS